MSWFADRKRIDVCARGVGMSGTLYIDDFRAVTGQSFAVAGVVFPTFPSPRIPMNSGQTTPGKRRQAPKPQGGKRKCRAAERWSVRSGGASLSSGKPKAIACARSYRRGRLRPGPELRIHQRAGAWPAMVRDPATRPSELLHGGTTQRYGRGFRVHHERVERLEPRCR